MKLRPTITCLLLLLVVMTAKGQITIGGNVYGGGNHAEVKGSTKVTVRAGDIGAVLDPDAKRPIDDPRGKVFGGARAANVGGNTFVHIDGEHASDYIVINQVFGGNDVAGTIGTAKAVSEDVPEELTAVKRTEGDKTDPKKDDVDETWNSYVRISTKVLTPAVYYTQAEIDEAKSDPTKPAYGKTINHIKTPAVPADDAKKVFIGQVYAGGNGDFDYEQSEPDENGKVTHTIYNWGSNIPIATTVTDVGKVGFHLPTLDKAYLDVEGGTISFAYGGGNNTTVNDTTVIHVDNPSKVVTHLYVDGTGKEYSSESTGDPIDLLCDERFQEMGINTTFNYTSNPEFQVGRFYGGNNTAEMDIQPGWNLLSGKIRNLYSGGNRGRMTYRRGLLLEIPTYSTLVADNVYGGCRMADVRPMKNGANTTAESIPGYFFPTGFSARVLIRGGDVNNVYGGNDITGTVYGGNAVGIYATVRGNVYGGGNGAYPYTDTESLKDSPCGDFYYEVPGGKTSYEALNDFRPNAEQVSIRIRGTDDRHPTVVQGSIFLGGNCASLDTKTHDNPRVELKIGSYAIANNVFLGNNGEGMIDNEILKYYAGKVDDEGRYTTGEDGTPFSSLNLKLADVFANYMEGVAMKLQPSIVFDRTAIGDPQDYDDYTSYVGSFYCGGNVGSMTIAGKNVYKIDRGLNIFEKFVGGCNSAHVLEGPYNAEYDGGVLGSATERYRNGLIGGNENYWTDDEQATGNIKDRLEIELTNLTITPLRWGDRGLIWNTQKWGYTYTALEAGTKLKKGDVYYASIPFTEQTIEGSDYTVTKNDKFFKKLEDNVYTSIATGTVLPVGSKYYEHTDTKITVTNDEGYTAAAGDYLEEEDFVEVPNSPIDKDVRLLGGNIYGGCYNSGHVNGNVTININDDMLKRTEVFSTGTGPYGRKASGVELEDQRDDLDAVALAVFGAGYGEDTEIWGSTTVNHNNGYAFQIYGGGEEGIVGRKKVDANGIPVLDENDKPIYEYDPRYSSTVNLNGTVTTTSSTDEVEDLAETEYIYGGGNEGDVCGNTYVYLGNGRIYDAFGGASDADILGHTEVYIGRQPNGNGGYKDGFPWIRDIVYGGNDFGGTIWGEYEDGYDFTARIENYDQKKEIIHGYKAGKIPDVMKAAAYVEYLQGRVDTIFGGNYGYYDYTSDKYAGSEMPYVTSTFVNIRPKLHDRNAIACVHGGGTGYPKYRDGDKSQDRSYVLIDIPDGVDKFKNTEVFGAGSYNGLGMRFQYEQDTFDDSFDPDQLSAIIDLMHGQIGNVYGGSYNEGATARTVVNVPKNSTASVQSIFGGAYGTQILPPCDVYESNVNYSSENASVAKAIYGGNNNERRTLFANVNISAPVWSDKTNGKLATVYGAGKGIDTWSEYTEVHLNKDAKVYEVYGGGEMGHVLNSESVQKYMQLYQSKPSDQISKQDPKWSKDEYWELVDGKKDHLKDDDAIKAAWAADWKDAWTLGGYYEPTEKDTEDEDGDGDREEYTYNDYLTNHATNLGNTALVRTVDMDDRDYSAYVVKVDDVYKPDETEIAKRKYKYNTNVIIHEGATVENYAYGGGYGTSKKALSGDIYGSTYIALLGGTVKKDIYAAGTSGSVNDIFGVGPYNPATKNGFTASSNVYIKGGTCRNVYGGGWEGHVGSHTGDITASPTGDLRGETHVVIGDMTGTTFASGVPAIQRNAYGGGEGGAVYGDAYLTMNNGYVGYVHLTDKQQQNEQGEIVATTATGLKERYEEKIIDETHTDKETGEFIPNTNLEEAGCLFGGGYVDNSSVDKTHVLINGGNVRNSAFGGGEIAAIGRGNMKKASGGKTAYVLNDIYRPGQTNIEMYSGHVYRNVFGGGRGYDNLGKHGTLHCDGYVFGQTRVGIYGGEIGTVAGIADGDGNVFGGGDAGFVYSAYENSDGSFGKGVQSGVRYDGNQEGYYYKHKWDEDQFILENGERVLTEDCNVLVEPRLKVITPVTINNHAYSPNEFVTIEDLNTLKNKHDYDKNTETGDSLKWVCLDQTGIIIHNAIFAGGNMPSGSTATSANTASVLGNATASVNDCFHRDMITMGTRNTGGLYGDGNLTLVDGYRELNITNYGTDYYSIAKNIKIEDYHALPERERAYYELKYTCLKDCQDKDGTRYKAAKEENGVKTKASTITADDMQALFVEYDDDKKEKVSVKNDGIAILVYDPDRGEWVPNTAEGANFWEESGVLPVYAGRLMNSIQRADLCGVFGSRMVMQGAKDRVPDEADYNDYTINRVREVSLNKNTSTAGDGVEHGNYFGIYSIVNYLGALTSDVDFEATRTTENTNTETYGPEKDSDGNNKGDDLTYYNWKKKHIKDKTRNNGSSHNKVALASGVYLEITTEESTGPSLYEKVWGPITGVVELDLINVSPGIGGGFVYAKNIHGKRVASGLTNTTLTKLNKNAVTKKDYRYIETNPELTGDAAEQYEWETSGNFVHSTQTIIDDCYNVSNRYLLGESHMPAHFWYIKGSTYVYDQYISAYTGMPNAFSETVDIPLTIAAASHGTLKLLNVQPNRYAYYAATGVPLENGKKMVINDKTYYANDPISYWDWYLLSKSEQELFIPMTYVNCVAVSIDGGELHEAGTIVLNPTEYANYGTHTYRDAKGEIIYDANKDANDEQKVPADKDYIFRMSNSVSHNEGYILTYEVNNPGIWDNWYTPKDDNDGDKITQQAYDVKNTTDKEKYEDGPTYYLNETLLKVGENGLVLGQEQYKEGDIITKNVEDTYQAITNKLSTTDTDKQAIFEEAYIVTKKISVTAADGSEHHYNPGVAVSKTFANGHSGSVEKAYICTNTIEMTKEDYIYRETKMSATERNGYITDVTTKLRGILPEAKINNSRLADIKKVDDLTAAEQTSLALTEEQKKQLSQLLALRNNLNDYLVPAYYCTKDGLYGGNYYEKDHNYRALEAWSSLPEADRKKFLFNYDALDLLIDPDFTNANGSGADSEGHKYKYDGPNYTSEEAVTNSTTGNKAGYSIKQSIDYTASYNSETNSPTLTHAVTVKRGETSVSGVTSLQKGDELDREEFEKKLVNEQRHYTPIVVKNGTLVGSQYTVYVVNTDFQIGSTPYTIGETISNETYDALPEKNNVTLLTFDKSTDENSVYYYCREAYPIPEAGGHAVKSVKGTNTNTYAVGATVPVGAIISHDNVTDGTGYSNLTNEQKNFTIHGISPTETSTLFVSRESNIYDLSNEKIITAIYQYDYDEIDGNGNVTPISERHVVNIHLQFKSGAPTVDDINKPEIILPGWTTEIAKPKVTPGAYEVTGGGWELFETQRDAESHINGTEYDPTFDKLYWYQDGHYVAYYAKSYLGRTYSNAVPVSVANYHDLKEVMDDTDHHMYIDNKGVKRDPKIYIKDYTTDDPATTKNGLDLFKNLYDLSVLDSYSVDEDGLITSGDFQGHKPLDKQVRAERNLEFFLQADIDHSDNPWTPIGYDGTCDNPETTEDEGKSGKCFDGVLHGDGHKLSGLSNSLFNYLCGEVYNLGVTGSFTGGGIAENGGGYVESCWVKTTETPDASTKAVFGNPTASGFEQVVNCYYPESNSGYTAGKAIQMPDKAFYNGEVAYDLNNFYLYKRYNDKAVGSGTAYKYFTVNDDNSLTLQPVKHYASNPALCSSGYLPATPPVNYVVPMYVEQRFADGDFRYAGGTIPGTKDDRYYVETVTENNQTKEEVHFYPIWPDDYIFFGQKLTYGWGETAHQDEPTAVVRDAGRLSLKDDANRVYRAPAYYQSMNMSVAHFNPAAYLAQKEQLTEEQIAYNEEHPESAVDPRAAYPNMTAIDFAGHNDTGYTLGRNGTWFYQPLLDDDGLVSIRNCDETQNLVVYAPAETAATEGDYANKRTHDVLTSYFTEPVFNKFYDRSGESIDNYSDGKVYDRVADASAQSVNGHLVQHNLTVINDHLLVDKQDFNAPISYSFDDDHRMWYQRKPTDQEFVNRTTDVKHNTGWQGISLPFTVQMVSTQDKGEITHFYNSSVTSGNGTGTKIGHEYWLRELNNITVEGSPAVAKAEFVFPTAAGSTKTVENKFLWDYYYENVALHNRKDKNDDTYQEYYSSNRTYPAYPFLAASTPYILGLPGQTYYEFDLSGKWEAKNTAVTIPKLYKQVVSFVSPKGVTIGVSDVEIAAARTLATKGGFTFVPSYMRKTLQSVSKDDTTTPRSYAISSDGSAYNAVLRKADDPKGTNNVVIEPFRPYFAAASSPVRRNQPRQILFTNADDGFDEEHENEDLGNGTLSITSRLRHIIVSSTLREPSNVTITNTAGLCISTFTIEPGQTVETPVIIPGLYIVNHTKIIVR